MNNEVYNRSMVHKKLSNIHQCNLKLYLKCIKLFCIELKLYTTFKEDQFSFLKYHSWVINLRNDAFANRIFTRRQKLFKNFIFVGK